MTFSKHEAEVMGMLWKQTEGLTNTEMIETSPNRSWKDSTIHLLINGLLNKGAIEEIGKKPSGRRFSRIFAPLITLEDYQKEQIKIVLSEFDGIQLVNVVSAFVENKPLSKKERAALIKLLDDMEEV